MSTRRVVKTLGLLLAIALVCIPTFVVAQPPGPGGEGGRDRMARGGGFDPEQMRQRVQEMQERRLEGVSDSLGIEGDEWTAVKPLVEKVFELQTATAMGGGMMGLMGGRRGGPGAAGAQRPAWMPEEIPEAKALRECLDKESSDAQEVKAKLEAYRAARKRQDDELQAARDALRAVLTAKQEAQAVLDGILN